MNDFLFDERNDAIRNGLSFMMYPWGYGCQGTQTDKRRRSEGVKALSAMWEEKVGVLHVHSRYSDGWGSVASIARAASKAGLDFVVITDHDSLAGLEAGLEGRYGNTAVIFGYEISPHKGNHYIVLGSDEVMSKEDEPRQYVKEVAARGGIGFIAHPDYPPPEEYPLNVYPWTDWDVEGYTGLEIWSYTVDWLTGVTTLPKLLHSLLFPKRYIDGPFPKTLARWDELCNAAWQRGRRVVGVGAADAHGILYSYRRMFQAMRMHLFVGSGWGDDVAKDKVRLFEALREGRAYIAYDGLQDARGFRFGADNGTDAVVMGAPLQLADGVTLKVKAPLLCRLTLLRGGETVLQAETSTLKQRINAPGVYRVEAHLRHKRGWLPWIFSNPIYVH